jgi:hypothetical protein
MPIFVLNRNILQNEPFLPQALQRGRINQGKKLDESKQEILNSEINVYHEGTGLFSLVNKQDCNLFRIVWCRKPDWHASIR